MKIVNKNLSILNLIFLIFVFLISCKALYFANDENMIFVSNRGFEGKDSIILYPNGYFYYKDPDYFSEGHWTILNHKTILLNSNSELVDNIIRKSEFIDSSYINDDSGNHLIITYYLKYIKFNKDTIEFKNGDIIRFRSREYLRWNEN